MRREKNKGAQVSKTIVSFDIFNFLFFFFFCHLKFLSEIIPEDIQVIFGKTMISSHVMLVRSVRIVAFKERRDSPKF